MDFITLKSGLELAVIGVAMVCVLFVFYWKLGQVTLEKRENEGQRDSREAGYGTHSAPHGEPSIPGQ
ncbi:hypothetical protein F6V30_08710 [Oryzomonas sagensis]|uniref:Uncharacterized protein n=1 Tax=Oryzomonas sagensis TaxID=2603857 RepID=A0ABQ6TNX1_9BACT|nr:hypothetical protein [Oryzomonas sagensis]KAB0670230.1 hypothetical protein F6V30_08710 [Oryzomonas sagensis]